jgi:hypothetical protein
MTHCRNCGRAFESGFLSLREFCSDGCKKDYEIKTRTLEGGADSQQWKKNCLMLAEATHQTVPGLRDLLQLWGEDLCRLRKGLDEALRDNVVAWTLLERVTLAESNLDPTLLHEIRKGLGDWTSGKGEKMLEDIRLKGPLLLDAYKETLSSWLCALQEMERASQIMKRKVADSL